MINESNSDMLRQRCKIHYGEGCHGPIQTRRSIYGAVQSACEKGWTQPYTIHADQREAARTFQIQLEGWPEVIG